MRASLGKSLIFVMVSAVPCAFATTFTYSTINVPGATYTPQASGINNAGVVAGYFVGASGFQGFVDNNGAFTNLSVPGFQGTQILAINNYGQVAGSVITANGGRNAFAALGGTPAALNIFGSGLAEASGINDSDQIVGYYAGPTVIAGFSYKNGVATSLFYPGSYVTEATGVNNAGEIVGFYADRLGYGYGFTYLNGVFGSFAVPGDPHATPTAINNHGEIVGTLSGDSAFEGFVDENGIVSTVFVPGSFGTEVMGVNDLGQVVGFYFDPAGGSHAFEATPTPEPASWMMGLTGSIAMSLLAGSKALGSRRLG